VWLLNHLKLCNLCHSTINSETKDDSISQIMFHRLLTWQTAITMVYEIEETVYCKDVATVVMKEKKLPGMQWSRQIARKRRVELQ